MFRTPPAQAFTRCERKTYPDIHPVREYDVVTPRCYDGDGLAVPSPAGLMGHRMGGCTGSLALVRARGALRRTREGGGPTTSHTTTSPLALSTHSLPLTPTHSHSLPLTPTRSHSLPPTPTHSHSLPLTPAHPHTTDDDDDDSYEEPSEAAAAAARKRKRRAAESAAAASGGTPAHPHTRTPTRTHTRKPAHPHTRTPAIRSGAIRSRATRSGATESGATRSRATRSGTTRSYSLPLTPTHSHSPRL